MSETELEYLERRRRNTEYMEQIERERGISFSSEPKEKKESPIKTKAPVLSETEEEEMPEPPRKAASPAQQLFESSPQLVNPERPVTDDLKVIEQKESEREALLRLDRNPEPPSDLDIAEKENEAIGLLAELAARSHAATEEELAELKKRERIAPGNGSVDMLRRLSDSTLGSPQGHLMEHSYCMPPEKQSVEPPVTSQQTFVHDHGYTNREEVLPPVVQQKPIKEKAPRQRKTKHKKLTELQNLQSYQEHIYQPTKTIVHDMKFKERDMVTEMNLLYEFLTKGIDSEDINYLRQSYNALLADDAMGYWLNDTHWVDHCVTDLYSSPPKRRKRDEMRVHATGCARTEGFYKITATEKAKYKYHHARHVNSSPNAPVSKMQGKVLWKISEVKFFFAMVELNILFSYYPHS